MTFFPQNGIQNGIKDTDHEYQKMMQLSPSISTAREHLSRRHRLHSLFARIQKSTLFKGSTPTNDIFQIMDSWVIQQLSFWYTVYEVCARVG
jgi:hypothetical protein